MDQISEITPLPEEGRIQVRVLTPSETGVNCFRYDFHTDKDEFTAYVENPEYGGQAGDAVPYIAALGW